MVPPVTTPLANRFATANKFKQDVDGRSALAPGKYCLNPHAVKIELVPIINFVLRWISGQTEAYRYGVYPPIHRCVTRGKEEQCIVGVVEFDRKRKETIGWIAVI